MCLFIPIYRLFIISEFIDQNHYYHSNCYIFTNFTFTSYKMSILIILFLFFYNCKCNINQYAMEPDVLYVCFQNAISTQKFNQFPYITHVINENESPEIQHSIATSLSQVGLPVKILKDTTHAVYYKSSIFYKSFMYVIYIKNELEFQEKLYKIKNSVSWNPSAKFWILVPKFSEDFIKFVLKQLWTNNAVNVVIIFKTKAGVNIITWFPYDRDFCGNFVGKLYVINKCNSHGQLIHKKEIFPNKVPKNLNACPVKTLYLRWLPAVIDPMSKSYPGYEVEIMKILAQVANITLVYMPLNITKLGQRNYRGNWTEILGTLQVNGQKGETKFCLLFVS